MQTKTNIKTNMKSKHTRRVRANSAMQSHGGQRDRGVVKSRKRTSPARWTSEPPLDAQTKPAAGILELHPKGYGFLRSQAADLRPQDEDVFIPAGLVRRLGLRTGSLIVGTARQRRQEQGARLEEIQSVDGLSVEDYRMLKGFGQLTPINPRSQLRLETGREPLTTRVVDLLTPIGKGQRALVVAPPRTGKTVLLQLIGQAIGRNYPDVELFVLLIDERPEEVTDMRRSIPGKVFASSLDRDVESHVRLSRLVVERCKRLVEQGRDVVLLVDSLTRMSRAFNKWVGNNGRTMTGGLDIRALDIPKNLFATARAFDEGASLTIVATVLVETGSRMDDLIFEEFKGTGNSELALDRRLADRRIWPAVDVSRSGTRREELLIDASSLHTVTMLRRTMSTMNEIDAMQLLTTQLAKFDSNQEFLSAVGRQAALVA